MGSLASRVVPMVCAAWVGLGCGAERRIVLDEDAPGAPLFRVAVAFTSQDRALSVLEARAPFELNTDGWNHQDPLDVWIFRYERAEAEAAFPGLAGLDGAAMVAKLEPRFVTLGEASTALADPSQILRTTVKQGASLKSGYQLAELATWKSELAVHPDHHFTLEVPAAEACKPLQAQRIELPPGVNASAIAATGERTAMFVGTSSAGALIGSVSGTSAMVLAALDLPDGVGGRLAWDPAHRRALTISGDRVLAFDDSGQALPLPLPDSPPSEVSAGRDGTVVAVFNREAHVLERDAWVSEGRTEGVRGPSQLVVLSHDVHYAFRDCWIMSMAFEAAPSPDFRWSYDRYVDCRAPRSLAADGVAAYDIGFDGHVHERIALTSWPEISGFDPDRSRSIIGLGARRVAVGGDDGYLVARLRGRLCSVPVPGGGAVVGGSAWLDSGVGYFLVLDPATGEGRAIIRLAAAGPG